MIRNSMLEKTPTITFTRPQLTRWELAKFVVGRSFYMMVVLLFLESILTAATTYLIIKAGRDVANDEFLTADLLWILAAQASAYVAATRNRIAPNWTAGGKRSRTRLQPSPGGVGAGGLPRLRARDGRLRAAGERERVAA